MKCWVCEQVAHQAGRGWSSVDNHEDHRWIVEWSAYWRGPEGRARKFGKKSGRFKR